MIDLDDIVRKNIAALLPYSSARDEYSGDEAIFLDANENPFGDLNRYPDSRQKKLKNKLAELKNISKSNIFIGNGSDEIIDLILRIFCTPGVDKALTFSPTYGMYDVSATINDVELLKLPLNKDFQIDMDCIEKYLSDNTLKIIFICSPNNPTGNLISKKDIAYILNKFKGIVFVDEAYIDFNDSLSWVDSLDNHARLIVGQTMSKAWGLANVRVGVAYSNTAIVELLDRVKPPYNVSGLNQKAALSALADPILFEDNLNRIKQAKRHLIAVLKLVPQVVKIYPSDANFLLIEVSNADKIYSELVNQKIITRNRNNVMDRCIRITVGTIEENNQLINTLKKITT